MPYNTMMRYIPLPEELKVEMYGELFACCMPIFQDRTVFVLMVLIVIFDQEGSEDIRMLKQRFITILRRYLEENTQNDVLYDMQNIFKCIKRLPELLRIFRRMSSVQIDLQTDLQTDLKIDLQTDMQTDMQTV